ncbi:hypothetical protein [Polynucleobacter sp. AM-25C3]|uniref:hypothetical protein n=1 Tax=Polynucleobacter sp. AM-25C3 TaxID=1855569 RepID=UPI001C0AEAAC|nr:hypothetical protein [Polynucleobacter sp. AM-25C3]MBU3602323.1 hypothetical protein [Polynucleobacter sp. AM-25C3]
MDNIWEALVLVVIMFMLGGGTVITLLAIVSCFWKWRLKIRIINCFNLGIEKSLTMEEIFILSKRHGLSKFEIQSTLKWALDTATKLDSLELRQYCLQKLTALDEHTAFDDLPDTIRNNLLKINSVLEGSQKILALNLADNLQEFSKRKNTQRWVQIFISFVGGTVTVLTLPWIAALDWIMSFLR